jgi:hypothetical protein
MAIEDAVVLSTLTGKPQRNLAAAWNNVLEMFYQVRHQRIEFLQSKALKLYQISTYPNGPLQQERDRQLQEEMRLMEALDMTDSANGRQDLGPYFARDSPNFLSDVWFRDEVFAYDAKSIGEDAVKLLRENVGPIVN